MAAVFLVTIYEYSPLFYIAVVFVCFLVTSGLVLGWFGWDVPVILRNSEETESSAGVSKKHMRQVKNPFGLEILHPTAASVTKGITLKPDCLEDCFLTCYWGCSVQKLYEALQKHIYCFRIKTPQALEDALYNEYLYRQQYFIKKTNKEEKYCQLSEDAQITDFGPVPRSRYPLVALLTLAEEEDREIYDIISMVSIIHVPDESYRLSCRILYQYLLLAQGQFHDLKVLLLPVHPPGISSVACASSVPYSPHTLTPPAVPCTKLPCKPHCPHPGQTLTHHLSPLLPALQLYPSHIPSLHVMPCLGPCSCIPSVSTEMLLQAAEAAALG
ncbi:PREDICTED: cell growth regulator with RING finger domain protein 1 isoform X2 [Crocodylus porosus]|nr:PREDICTED: cell growth regulator with RING finger domain protein 1 isoform X2 [Crocodylus porosus]